MSSNEHQVEQTALPPLTGSEFALGEGFGHPGTQEPGWDLLEIRSVSEDALSEAIRHAEKVGWNLWIRDNTGKRSAAMYRKSSPNDERSDETPLNTGSAWRYDEPQQQDGQMCCTLRGQVAVPRGDLFHGGWTYESWKLIRAGMPWMTIEDAEKYNDEHGPIPQPNVEARQPACDER